MSSKRRRMRRTPSSRDKERKLHYFETLEDRRMLKLEPIANELLVNDLVIRAQSTNANATSIDANGDRTVVAFSGKGPVDRDGVFAKVYDENGEELTPAFRVNSTTRGLQEAPSVAVHPDGSFVVSWNGRGPGDKRGVFFQRFDRQGRRVGPETLATQTTGGDQVDAVAVALPNSEFIVGWSGTGLGDLDGVFARKFNASGSPVTNEVRINNATQNQQDFLAMTADDSGALLATWSSRHQDGSDWGIYAQRFDSSLVAIGSEFLVASTHAFSQVGSSVSTTSTGDQSVVTWASHGQDGESWGIFGKRLDENGSPIGDEFQLNSVIDGHQIQASVAMNDDGSFTATWSSGIPDGSGWEIHTRSFDADGEPIESDAIVNAHTSGVNSGHQHSSAVAVSASGVLAATYSGNGEEDHAGVFTQLSAGVTQTVSVGPVADQIIDEETEFSIIVPAEMSDGSAVTFSLDRFPPGSSIDASTGEFSWTPTEEQGPGAYAVTVVGTSVSFPELSDDTTFIITVNEVNRPPVLDPIADQTIEENTLAVFTATASDPDIPINMLVFTLGDDAPQGAEINGLSGEFSWRPIEAQGPGEYSFDVIVTDSGNPGLSDSQEVTITVAEVNQPPVIAQVSDITIDEETTLVVVVTATDPDIPENDLTFRFERSPEGATLDKTTGEIRWLPDEILGPGTYPFTVAVDDNGEPSLSDSTTFIVTVLEVNQPPVLDPIAPVVGDEETVLTFTATATDPDTPANTLAFTLGDDAPEGASIDANTGVFTWQPTEADGPTATSVMVIVTDSGDPQLSDSQVVPITVREVNRPPVLSEVNDETLDRNDTLVVALSASDPDIPRNNLRFSLDSAPNGATIDQTSGEIRWNPSSGDSVGRHAFVARVTDDGSPNLFDTEEFTVTVTGDVLPLSLQIDDQETNEQEELSFLISVDGVTDTESLVFEIENEPAGSTTIPEGANALRFVWTPTEAQGPGDYPGIVVTATDENNTSRKVTSTFAIGVNEVNEPPILASIADQTLARGNTLQLTLRASDPDIPENNLTFALDEATLTSTGATIDSETGLIEWFPNDSHTESEYSFTAIVNDNGVPNLSDTKSFVVSLDDECPFVDFAAEESGGSDGNAGGVEVNNCVATLREGNSFVVTFDTSFIVPQEPASLSFTYDHLLFDATDTNGFINDAFEVALVDSEGNSLVQTFVGGRDSFFNITETLVNAPTSQPPIVVNDQTVAVPLNDVIAGTEATLILRLINEDNDTTTSVQLINIDIPTDAAGGLRTETISSVATQSATASTGGTPRLARRSGGGNANFVASVASQAVAAQELSATTGVLDEDGSVRFTTNSDFEMGETLNLSTRVEPDALVLNPADETEVFPFIWIANSGEGTVSKFDVRTGVELGRYRTGADSLSATLNPSRTAVTPAGDVWVGNRIETEQSSVVKVLNNGFIDRNGNGVVDTAVDLNSDGRITIDEVLPWDANGDGQPDDERIAFGFPVGWNSVQQYQDAPDSENSKIAKGNARSMAFDHRNNVWVGIFHAQQYEVYDNNTGELVDIVKTDGSPYGGVVDRNGILWGATVSRYLEQIDTNTRTKLERQDTTTFNPNRPGDTYGVTLDADGVVWVSNRESNYLTRFSPSDGSVTKYPTSNEEQLLRGIAVDFDGNVWMASTSRNYLIKYTFEDDRKTLIKREEIPLRFGDRIGDGPTAAVVDTDGFIWTTAQFDDSAWKIDPNTNQVVAVYETGDRPYNYSDMTGVVRGQSNRVGTWTEIVDAGRDDAHWATVRIDDVTPGDTTVAIRARVSNSEATLESLAWQEIESEERLFGMSGRYLEVQVELASTASDLSPLVEEIEVQGVLAPELLVNEPEAGSDLRPSQYVLSGTAIAHDPSISSTATIGNSLTHVTVNGVPAEVLDGAGNFFTRIEVVPGKNEFEVTAFDLLGQMTTDRVVVNGTQLKPGEIDFNRFADITGSFSEVYGRTSFNEENDELYVDLATKNDGRFEADVPLLVAVENLSDSRISVLDNDGVTPDGLPYFDFTDQIPGGTLGPNEVSDSPTIGFSNEDRIRFDYYLRFYGLLNQAPVISTVPVIEAIVDFDYEYDVDAFDEDGDVLSYRLTTPDDATSQMDMAIESGVLTWRPTSEDVGNHEISVQVSDGRGGFAEQTYILAVIEPPNNRPPIITTLPETVATVSPATLGEFEIEWSTEDIRISDTTEPSGAARLFVDSNDDVHIAFHEGPVHTNSWRDDIFYAKFSDAGEEIVAATSLNTKVLGADHWNSLPSITATSTNQVHVVWHSHSDEFCEELFHVALGADGTPLTAPTQISQTEEQCNTDLPRLVTASDDSLYVVFQDELNDPDPSFDNRRNDVFVQKLRIDGNAVSALGPLTEVTTAEGTGPNNAGFVDPLGGVVIDPKDDLHIVWADWRNSNDFNQTEIYYESISSDGRTIVDETPISEVDDVSATWAVIDIDSEGIVHSLWIENRQSESALVHARVASGGDAVTRRDILKGEVGSISTVSLGIDTQDRLHVVYTNPTESTSKILYQRFDAYGNLLVNPVVVTESVGSATIQPGQSMDVADDSTVSIVWTDTRDGNDEVYLKSFRVRELGEITYRYDVDAIDPDFDPIEYSLIQSPSAMNIDSESGLITWAPEINNFDGLGDSSANNSTQQAHGGVTAQRGVLVEVFADQGVQGPTQIAFGPDGDLFVANWGDTNSPDTNILDGSIARIAPNGISSVFASDHWVNPSGIAVADDGTVYVSDTSAERDNPSPDPDAILISTISPDGTVLPFAGRYGDGVTNTKHIAIVPETGEILVADNVAPCSTDGECSPDVSGGLHRISPNGEIALESLELVFPNSIAIRDSEVFIGNFYVDRNENNSFQQNRDTIQRIDTDGNVSFFAHGIQSASGLVFDDTGRLYVSEDVTGRILILDDANSDNTITNDEISVFAEGIDSPQGLAFDQDGNLYVSEFKKDRILRFSEVNIGLTINDHLVSVAASDGRGGVDTQTFVVSVKPDPQNNPPVFVSEPVRHISPPQQINEPISIDESWETLTLTETNSDQFRPDWTPDGASVTQTKNANASIFLSPTVYPESVIEATLRVEEPSSDDEIDNDFIGLVFGYEDQSHYYLLDWKGDDTAEDDDNLNATAGVRLIKFDLTEGTTLTFEDYWRGMTESGEVETLARNDVPWQFSTDYQVRLEQDSSGFHVEVFDGNTSVFQYASEVGIDGGRIGFFNNSQVGAAYSGLRRTSLFPTYRYDADAVDPDGDDLTYHLVDGPDGMTVDRESGEVTWEPSIELRTDNAIRFEDTEFEIENWQLQGERLSTDHVSFNVEVSEESRGQFAKITINTPGAPSDDEASRVLAYYENINATYDPSLSGEILEINYSENVVVFDSVNTSAGQAGGIALRQGNDIYFAPYSTSASEAWISLELRGLTANDFGLVSMEPAFRFLDRDRHPDFSANAEQIHFGFVRTVTTCHGCFFNFMVEAGIDNWQVEVVPSIKETVELVATDSRGGIANQEFPVTSAKSGSVEGFVYLDENDDSSWNRRQELLVSTQGEIHRFLGSTGEFIDKLNPGGTTQALGPNGELYVVNLDEIIRYDRDGNFSGVVAQLPPESEIHGLAFNPEDDQHLYASNRAFDRIERFNLQTGESTVFADGRGKRPIGLAFHEGQLYAGTQAEVVSTFDGATGAHIADRQITRDVAKVGVTALPAIAFNDVGTLFVTNFEGHSIVRWNVNTGRFEEFVAPRSGGLELPHSIVVGDENDLYVSSNRTANGEVLRFDGESGEFLGVVAAGEDQFTPAAIQFSSSRLVDESGLVGWTVFVDRNQNRVLDSNEPFAVTNVHGKYRIEGLSAGNHDIVVQSQTGFRLSDGAVQYASLTPGSSTYNVDFGVVERTGEIDENTPPVFDLRGESQLPDQTTTLGDTFKFDVDAFDADGDPLEYSLTLGPDGAAIDPVRGTVVWTPGTADLGQHDFIVAVDDGKGGVDSTSFDVVVQLPNYRPAITSTAPTTALQGQPFEYVLTWHDQEADEVSFTVEGPDGITVESEEIDSQRFVRVLWAAPTLTPGSEDPHTIVIRASDGVERDDFVDGLDKQTFGLRVDRVGINDPPSIEPVRRTSTRFGREYVYQLQASDLNGDPLAYNFGTQVVSGSDGVETEVAVRPDGMTLGERGLIRWTPTDTDAGQSFPVAIVVDDGRGGTARFDFAIDVTSQSQNSAPTIVSNPVMTARQDVAYSYNVVADDPDGDPIGWSLDQAPVGMSINPDTGSIRWVPTLEQLGAQEIIVRATDALGASATQTFIISATCNNGIPHISSIPPTEAIATQLYVYAVRATDPEGDELDYQLIAAPETMTIGPNGVIRWTPPSDEPDRQRVIVRVEDTEGGYAVQDFVIGIDSDENANLPPVITSRPSSRAMVDRVYEYQVVARDDDGQIDSYSLSVPDQLADILSIDTSGLIQWQPDESHVGVHPINVIVTDDDGGLVSQGFALTVSVNTPPTIESIGGKLISDDRIEFKQIAGQSFVTQVIANANDDNDTIVGFELTDQPAGMSIDSLGRILWSIPDDLVVEGDEEYRQEISVTAFDSYDAASETKSFSLTVSPDSEAPEVSITVNAGTREIASGSRVDLGAKLVLEVKATDEVGISTRSLSINGQNVALDSRGKGVFDVPSDPKNLFYGDPPVLNLDIVATASDLARNENSASVEIRVRNQFDNEGPDLELTSIQYLSTIGEPQAIALEEVNKNLKRATQPITTFADVLGTIGDDMVSYDVWFNRIDQVDPFNSEIDSSNYLPLKGMSLDQDFTAETALATFNPTVLTNDTYVVWVRAFDANDNSTIRGVFVDIEGGAKFGEFSLAFTDVSIPVPGFPVEVTRVYDTREASVEGDFGYGWSMGVQDAQILETVPDGTAFVANETKVYLTAPTGARIGFTTEFVESGSCFLGCIGNVGFRADANVFFELSVEDDESQEITDQDTNETFLGDFLGNVFNPVEYLLTDPSGTVYTYHQEKGLTSVEDLNGNRVEYRAGGVDYVTNGKTTQVVEFDRDHRDRIRTITLFDMEAAFDSENVSETPVPLLGQIEYEYDLAGDLVSVTDRAGIRTGYLYGEDGAPNHFLTSSHVDDRLAFKAEFDDEHRFKGLKDSDGVWLELREYPIDDSRTAVIRDGNGNPTTLIYDDRGNVLEERNPLYVGSNRGADLTHQVLCDQQTTIEHMAVRCYGDPRHPDLETLIVDRVGNRTKREYDDRGNVERITQLGSVEKPLEKPEVTEFKYNARNQVRSITSARDYTTVFKYDDRGNLEEITNADNNKAKFTYDSQGRRETFTDFNGNTTRFEDYVGSQPQKIIFADDTYQKLEYNSFGQVLREAFYEANGEEVEVKGTEYDKLGRVVKEISGSDSDKSETVLKRFYDGDELSFDVIVHQDDMAFTGLSQFLESKKSRITSFEYDDRGQVIKQTQYNWNGPNKDQPHHSIVQFRYDANGNRILLQDPVGNITTWVYDALNQAVEERDPFYWDAKRKEEAFADLSDENFLEEVAPEIPWSPLHSDENRDPLYDDLSGASCDGGLAGADHTIVSCYDAEGNRTAKIDRKGRLTEYQYDHAGRLLKELWFDAVGDANESQVLSFTYDAVGNMETAADSGYPGVEDSDSRYTFSYDKLNRMTESDNDNGNEDTPRVILSYAYDKQGNVTKVWDNDGVTVESQYNNRNLLEWQKWFDAPISADGLPMADEALEGDSSDVNKSRVDYRYNAAGRMVGMDRYNALEALESNLAATTVRTYYKSGLSNVLNHNETFESDSLLSGYKYSYDFGGLLIAETRDHRDFINNRNIDYEYDKLGQLTSAVFDEHTQDLPLNEFYSYDENGNRITAHFGGRTFDYDEPASANQLTEDGVFKYHYDAEGNLKTKTRLLTDEEGEKGEVTTYAYDHRNRLVHASITSAGGIIMEAKYVYDALGRRIAKTFDLDGGRAEFSDEIHHFVYAHDDVWSDFAMGTVIARYLYRNQIDQIVGQSRTSKETTWKLNDRIGTVRNSLDMAGILARQKIGIFGHLHLGASREPIDRFSFAGREFDYETRQYFYRARIYDPTSGRFLTQDPLSFSAGEPSLYNFVGNSPPNGTDPTGTVTLETAIHNNQRSADTVRDISILTNATRPSVVIGPKHLVFATFTCVVALPVATYIGTSDVLDDANVSLDEIFEFIAGPATALFACAALVLV